MHSSPEPMKYIPPPLGPDEDELEHYKTQVKIMTDLINVSEGFRERERGIDVYMCVLKGKRERVSDGEKERKEKKSKERMMKGKRKS